MTRGQTTCATFLRSWAIKGAIPTLPRGYPGISFSAVAVVVGYFLQHDRQPRKVDVFPFLIILHFYRFYACISVVATIQTSYLS
jgi:hypothetical protein